MATKLTINQRLFADTYLADRDLNATRAYQSAYPRCRSVKAAESGASRTLSLAKVAAYIAGRIEKRSKDTGIDAKWVLTRLGQMVDADPCDIINLETGAYKAIQEWPLVWRRMLSAADVKELYEFDSETKRREKIGEIVKFRFIDKLKAYELIGRHIDVQAFKDKIDADVTARFVVSAEPVMTTDEWQSRHQPK